MQILTILGDENTTTFPYIKNYAHFKFSDGQKSKKSL